MTTPSITAPPAAAAFRAQPILYVQPLDASALAAVVRPALERVDAAVAGTQLLVVLPDAAIALALADTLAAGGTAPVLPITSARRGTRLLAAHAVTGVAASLDDAAALIRAASLKLDALRVIVVGGLDELLAAQAGDLEALVAELPKDVLRIATTAREGDAEHDFAVRHLRRARREAMAGGAPVGGALHHLVVTEATRGDALRRLLDAFDPPSASVVVSTPAAADAVARVLHPLGHGDGDALVRVVRDGVLAEHTALVVLWDSPTERDLLHAVAAALPVRAVTLVEPRQLAAYRALAGGATLPLDFPAPTSALRRHEAALRDELSAVLHAGVPLRELLAIEPLLVAHDAASIAAAALRLLEEERARARAAARALAAAGPPRSTSAQAMTRLYVGVGLREEITPGDLIAAIARETGIPTDQIGTIELRESHAIVEVAASEAARVVGALGGKVLRGRRLVVREDKGAPARSEGTERSVRRDREDRPARGDRPDRGARPERGARSGFGERPAGRGPARGGPRERPAGRGRDDPRGPGGPPRDSRGARDEGPRGPVRSSRGPAEGGDKREWAARGDALKHAKRPRRDDA